MQIFKNIENDLDNKAKIEETHELKETNEIDIKPVEKNKTFAFSIFFY